MMSLQSVTILGSTGSIGVSTLDVIARHADRYRVYALTANCRADVLFEQCRQFAPTYAVLLDEPAVPALQQRLRDANLATEVLTGADALEQVAASPDVDTVMAAIVGAAGLRPTLAAARAGKRILLANKETLVVAGALFMEAVRAGGATLLPVDSEHNAIFQCLPAAYAGNADAAGVRAIHLTASGGPFRDRSLDSFASITPDQACAHPNWVMGRKISVDSATMMNKGLEVIEAHWLFNVPPERIHVVIHPQSVIHSLVEYVDGSFIAQLGSPDMRTPIANALAYPERIEAGVQTLDFTRLQALSFNAPDPARYPCLTLAFAALAAGGTAPAILNAANEIAVAAFLEGRLGFSDIAVVIDRVMNQFTPAAQTDIESLLELDDHVRGLALHYVAQQGSPVC